MYKSIRRIWQVDALRGVALVLMIFYHAVFDLSFWGGFSSLGIASPLLAHPFFWHIFQRITAGIFLILSGASLQLKADTYKKQGKSKQEFAQSVFKQSLFVGAAALCMTAATWIFIPDFTIIFGVLHLLTAALWLNILPTWNRGWHMSLLFISVCVVALGSTLQEYRFQVTGFEWLGLLPENFQTLDYFPILPYWGVTLWGVIAVQLGFFQKVFTNKNLLWEKIEQQQVSRVLIYMGQHSLVIYLIHQPIILLIAKVLLAT